MARDDELLDEISRGPIETIGRPLADAFGSIGSAVANAPGAVYQAAGDVGEAIAGAVADPFGTVSRADQALGGPMDALGGAMLNPIGTAARQPAVRAMLNPLGAVAPREDTLADSISAEGPQPAGGQQRPFYHPIWDGKPGTFERPIWDGETPPKSAWVEMMNRADAGGEPVPIVGVGELPASPDGQTGMFSPRPAPGPPATLGAGAQQLETHNEHAQRVASVTDGDYRLAHAEGASEKMKQQAHFSGLVVMPHKYQKGKYYIADPNTLKPARNREGIMKWKEAQDQSKNELEWKKNPEKMQLKRSKLYHGMAKKHWKRGSRHLAAQYKVAARRGVDVSAVHAEDPDAQLIHSPHLFHTPGAMVGRLRKGTHYLPSARRRRAAMQAPRFDRAAYAAAKQNFYKRRDQQRDLSPQDKHAQNLATGADGYNAAIDNANNTLTRLSARRRYAETMPPLEALSKDIQSRIPRSSNATHGAAFRDEIKNAYAMRENARRNWLEQRNNERTLTSEEKAHRNAPVATGQTLERLNAEVASLTKRIAAVDDAGGSPYKAILRREETEKLIAATELQLEQQKERAALIDASDPVRVAAAESEFKSLDAEHERLKKERTDNDAWLGKHGWQPDKEELERISNERKLSQQNLSRIRGDGEKYLEQLATMSRQNPRYAAQDARALSAETDSLKKSWETRHDPPAVEQAAALPEDAVADVAPGAELPVSRVPPGTDISGNVVPPAPGQERDEWWNRPTLGEAEAVAEPDNIDMTQSEMLDRIRKEGGGGEEVERARTERDQRTQYRENEQLKDLGVHYAPMEANQFKQHEDARIFTAQQARHEGEGKSTELRQGDVSMMVDALNFSLRGHKDKWHGQGTMDNVPGAGGGGFTQGVLGISEGMGPWKYTQSYLDEVFHQLENATGVTHRRFPEGHAKAGQKMTLGELVYSKYQEEYGNRKQQSGDDVLWYDMSRDISDEGLKSKYFKALGLDEGLINLPAKYRNALPTLADMARGSLTTAGRPQMLPFGSHLLFREQ